MIDSNINSNLTSGKMTPEILKSEQGNLVKRQSINLNEIEDDLNAKDKNNKLLEEILDITKQKLS